MSFANPEIVQFYVQHRPTPPASLISAVLAFLKQERPGPPASASALTQDGEILQKLCVDVGCGSGQNTELYAGHFQQVVGLDVSSDQLAAARIRSSHPNLTFRKAAAESMPLDDASVDLVTCCISVHWFDIKAFYAEVERVLRPGGVLACYAHWMFSPIHHFKDLRDIVIKLWHSWQEYWPAGHELLTNDYLDLPDAYPEQVTSRSAERKFRVKQNVALDDLLGLIRSTAVFQNFKTTRGAQQAELSLASFKDRLKAEMGTRDEAAVLTVEFDFFLRMWRKPTL